MGTVALKLPNGFTCHLTSAAMWPIATFLRWEIYTRQRYLHPGFELRPTDTVLDVGGNIGMFVLWAAPQVPRGRIVTVEPNPSAVACMKVNLARNGIHNVTVLHAAAGRDGDGTEIVTYPGYEGLTHAPTSRLPWIPRLFARSPGPSERVTVPQISLGRLMDEHRLETVNYLKFDCEGAEYEILRNLEAPYWSRIERVAMEYHEYAPDQRPGELVEALTDHGFEVEAHATFVERHFQKCGAIWARRRA
jgi:FkbM family methyltransferase